MKELIERLRQCPVTAQKREAADALERLTTCNEHLASNCEVRTAEIERLTAERNELQDSFAVALLRARQLEAERDAALAASRHETDMCQQALDDMMKAMADVNRLTTELDSYKVSLQAAKTEVMRLIAERDAELKYTAWQSPHNDDLWLEHPADCEIIDNFHPPVHVGFEYELTAGSYTTQRYRVVKIADAESDDVLVELIAGEKHD